MSIEWNFIYQDVQKREMKHQSLGKTKTSHKEQKNLGAKADPRIHFAILMVHCGKGNQFLMDHNEF